MTDTATVSIQGVDYEAMTDSILQAANLQRAIRTAGTAIQIIQRYEYPQQHDDTIRMLLTVKVRASEYRGLRYIGTRDGVHAFLVV